MTPNSMPVSVVLAAAGFALYVTAVVVTVRLCRRISPALVAIGAALVAYVVVLIAGIATNCPVNFWATSAFFWCPTMIFLMAFGALYKSVSLRILVDLLARSGNVELCSAVLQRYIAAEGFETRLAIMLENK